MSDEIEPSESRQIGPYKVLSVLGEGGMGIVYLAEQSAPVRRRVALKILKPGMDTRQVLARFESERQALAVMDHPNIARALDGGMTDDGRPFFVMELVHGTPITQYADTHRLNTAERLRLFLDVCRAVQHAHQKGVIHRDLKPSNVMVAVHDSGPMVKVIDFGIAKAVGLGLTERTLVTRAGQLLGTPEYMSPEQAEMSGLDVDTRTDVYSLGVMLYELVVGALPFDLSSRPEYSIPHALRERDTPRPSTRLTGLGQTLPTVARYRSTTPEALRKELRGDLDWIILKAMEKDRTHRYETAYGLAVDIERHLNDEPVAARPPSTRDRLTKFVRRNRVPVTAVTMALLALVAGAGAAVIGHTQARQEQARAERAAATAAQVTDFLAELFRISDPGEARGNTVTAREVLDRGAQRIHAELGNQPEVQAQLMRVMGVVYRNLGLYDAAVPLLEQALATWDKTPGDPRSVERLRALTELGTMYRVQGRTAEAEAVLRRAVDLGRGSGDETGSLLLANAARSLAGVHLVLGRYSEAEPYLQEALAIQERLLGGDHHEVGTTLSNLSAMHLRQRQLQEAEPYLRRALRITERIYGGSHPYVADELNNLGALYALLGRRAEAESAYRDAYAIMTRVLDPDHPDMGRILHNLGESSHARGDLPEAEQQLMRALAIKEQAFGPDHTTVALTLRWLANVRRDQGLDDEASALYLRALGIYERSMDRPDASVAEALEDFAGLLRRKGRAADAAEMESRAALIRTGDA
jgi:eukaryotic-like serine/threonine-protein kinase